MHLSECPLPYVIMENFLPLVLTISSVDNYLGDPYFSFYYGSGKFSIRNNHCGCLSGGGKGKRAKAYCKCAFPHDGNAVGWKNAGIEFKA